MFPYTHLCFAKDLLGSLNSEKVLGAVFPDTVIAGFLTHADTHRRCGEIHKYLLDVGVFSDFAEALITHSTVPSGLDYFCDEKYLDFENGYAFEMARPIVDQVIECCHLPRDMGLWKAHNFIEMAAELWSYRQRTDCQGYLAEALANEDLILALGQVLAPFYGTTVPKIVMSFPVYGEHVVLDEITSIKLAEKYGMQTAKKHGISIDVPGAAGVIEKAVEIVDRTMPEFLANCKQSVGDLLTSLR